MKKLLLAVALVGTLVAPSVARAQTIVGPALFYHDSADFGVGGYVSIPLAQLHENLALTTSFGYFFPDVGDYWELNGDVIYRFPVSSDVPVLPFALAGLNIARSGSNTDASLNLGGGVVFPSDSFRPVVGAKFELRGGSPFVLFGGLGFTVG